MASSQNKYVTQGEGCWWVFNFNTMSMTPYGHHKDVRKEFDGSLSYELDEMDTVSVGEALRTQLPILEGKAWVSKDSPTEALLLLREEVAGCRWVLLNAQGEMASFETARDALRMLQSYDWQREFMISKKNHRKNLWYCFDDQEATSFAK